MIQFTKDNTMTLTASNGFNIDDNTLITGFVKADFNNTAYFYYQVDWYLGIYSDYPPSDFVEFKELPSDFKVNLYNEDGSDKYTLPTTSDQTNYKFLIDIGTYCLQQYIMENYNWLNGKLNIVFS